MNINKDVRDVKNKLTQLEKNKNFVSRNGVLEKNGQQMILKEDMVKRLET